MYKKLAAESLGTFILVFAGTGAIMINDIANAIGHVGIALTFGFVIVALIYSFAHVSGAHFNPAVTIAFWTMGEFHRKNVIPYISAQVFGAILASICLFFLLNENFNSVSEVSYLGSTLPRGSESQAFGFEFILTFILMIVICSSAVHGKATKDFAGLAIGLTVGLESMFAGPITGASMNPARSIGPAIVSGNFEHLWIYILATCLGAMAASMVFLKIFKSEN
jgi:MIP family channel proteins